MREEVVRSVLSAVDQGLSVRLTQELVRVPSVLGEEGPIGDLLEGQMRDLGFEAVQRQEVFPGRWNVIGEINFGPGPTIVLTGHMDTKPVSVGWEREPYGGDLEGDRLYGHGIMDMKAGLACQISAMKALTAAGLPLRGTVQAVAVCDHMGQQNGARAWFSEHRADMAVLGELTDNRVAIGHRGRYYWDITTLGLSAHTCHKYEAINAIPMAAELLLEIEKIRLLPDIDEHTAQLFGEELYTAVGRIYGGLPPGGPSMIPDECVIRVDSRPQPGVPSDVVRAVLQEAIDRVAARDPKFRYTMELADEKPPHMIDLDSPVVRYIREAAQIVQGESEVVGMSWLGDTSTFGPWVPTVIYGPGGEPVYMPNEYLPLSDIDTATKVYALTAAQALLAHQENGA